ncbi:hypothetical protein ARMSODRAFT_50107 [Armillaria solidipes]|uniref:Uncharacterized protein n=1 Tax=Armillaria solidipes TaxID=1076256 RepID=A0A2H3C9W9_9AGAR|nr:hypothetical protein ARMSODRAFT_50107 [Armillaria solidipes]
MTLQEGYARGQSYLPTYLPDSRSRFCVISSGIGLGDGRLVRTNEEDVPSCDGYGTAPDLVCNKPVLATELGIGDSFALQVHVPELMCTGGSRTEREASVRGVRLREPRTELEGSGTRTSNPAHSSKRVQFLIIGGVIPIPTRSRIWSAGGSWRREGRAGGTTILRQIPGLMLALGEIGIHGDALSKVAV